MTVCVRDSCLEAQAERAHVKALGVGLWRVVLLAPRDSPIALLAKLMPNELRVAHTLDGLCADITKACID